MKHTSFHRALFFALACASSASAVTLHKVDSTAELLNSDDIAIAAYKLDYELSADAWIVAVGVGGNSYGLDYVNSLFASSKRLEDATYLANGALTRKWANGWRTTLDARSYDGHSDYRSLWLSEYYRESWKDFTAYRAPTPGGQAVGFSTGWDYQPGAGKVEAGVDFGRDRVSPAWAFEPSVGQPVSSREILNTFSGRVRVEQALNGWLKTELSGSYRETSERDKRLGINHSWAASAGSWAFRIAGGYTEEEPSFKGVYGGGAVEYNFATAWTITARYRVYHDTGEVADSSFTAAAPGLDSTEIFLGLLWERASVALSLGVSGLETDYEPLSTDNSFFGDLYKDRDWINIRAAATFGF